ncbi:protein of unknown function [Paraburkholderia kururiensis]
MPPMLRENTTGGIASHPNANIPGLKSSYIKRARLAVRYLDEHPLPSPSPISTP